MPVGEGVISGAGGPENMDRCNTFGSPKLLLSQELLADQLVRDRPAPVRRRPLLTQGLGLVSTAAVLRDPLAGQRGFNPRPRAAGDAWYRSLMLSQVLQGDLRDPGPSHGLQDVWDRTASLYPLVKERLMNAANLPGPPRALGVRVIAVKRSAARRGPTSLWCRNAGPGASNWSPKNRSEGYPPVHR